MLKTTGILTYGLIIAFFTSCSLFSSESKTQSQVKPEVRKSSTSLGNEVLILPANLASGTWEGHYADVSLRGAQFKCTTAVNNNSISGIYNLTWITFNDPPGDGFIIEDTGVVQVEAVGDGYDMELKSNSADRYPLFLHGRCVSVAFRYWTDTDPQIDTTAYYYSFFGTIDSRQPRTTNRSITMGSFEIRTDNIIGKPPPFRK